MKKLVKFGCMGAVVLFAISIVVTVMSVSNSPSNSRQSASPDPGDATKAASKAHPDDGKQADRLEMIQDLIGRGLFVSVGYDGGTNPKVWIGAPFMSLSEKDQNTYLELVYAYYNIEDDSWGIVDGNPFMSDRLVIKVDDGTVNGKRVGKYDPYSGWSMD